MCPFLPSLDWDSRLRPGTPKSEPQDPGSYDGNRKVKRRLEKIKPVCL